MKFYFAGSISGGREDAPRYKVIVEMLAKHGEVLTEHVGDTNLVGQETTGATFIYDRDMGWLRSADVIVAEVSTPSLGVGYELGQAEALGKRVICLYREGSPKKLSQMISGNTAMEVIAYREVEELQGVFESLFASSL